MHVAAHHVLCPAAPPDSERKLSVLVVDDAHNLASSGYTDENIVSVSPCSDQKAFTYVPYVPNTIASPLKQTNRIVRTEVDPIRPPSASPVVIAVPTLEEVRLPLAVGTIIARILAFVDNDLCVGRQHNGGSHGSGRGQCGHS